MKTFEEAAAISFAQLIKLDGLPEAEAMLKQHADQFQCIADEAAQNDALTAYIIWLISAVAESKLEPGTALFSAFMAGLMTGVEMERAE